MSDAEETSADDLAGHHHEGVAMIRKNLTQEDNNIGYVNQTIECLW